MSVVLPAFVAVMCVASARTWLNCWRTAMLAGAVVWGGFLIAISEALSAVHLLNAAALGSIWGIALVAGVGLVIARRQLLPTIRMPSASRWCMAILGALAGMLLVLGCIAASAPPNTWDSMTYHMARVAHWIQNESLQPYPTHELRQLYFQPGAELVLLHLQILSGGDQYANCVQWASMVGALIGTSLIARDFGAAQHGQLVATLAAASVPIGILESTSTQNDYVVTFWLVCAVAFVLHWFRERSQWLAAALFGVSVGLALVTKATAYVFLAPALIWVCARLLANHGHRGLGPIALAAILALAINAGVYVRNAAVFGTPFGASDEGTPSSHYFNDLLTPQVLASNIVRDLGVHFVATPVVAINATAERVVESLHHVIGIDSNDPRTTWGSESFTARAAGLAFDENFASNPLQLMMLLVAAVVALVQHRRLPTPLFAYGSVLAAGFILFAAAFRWQPWHTRLELPLFILGAPIVGITVDRILPRLAVPLSVALLASMLPWVVYNQARPLGGTHSIFSVARNDQYFTNQSDLRQPYLAAVEFLAARECGRIGLLPGEWWEYPLWALLRGSVPGVVELEAVSVTNRSTSLQGRRIAEFEPCAILAADQATIHAFEFHGRQYARVLEYPPLTILTPD